MNVTQHFTSAEFDSHDGEVYPAEWIGSRLYPLCQVLEKLRVELNGAPITIVSGFRSSAHNIAVGGARFSQHVQGRAVDIVAKGFTPKAVHDALLKLYTAGDIEIGGLGLYPGWSHVDIRQKPAGGHLARWTGAGFGSEVA